MIDLGPLRTLLFVPGTRLDRVDKAFATAADAVIIDLEDAVPLAEKTAVRKAVSRLLGDLGSRRIQRHHPYASDRALECPRLVG